MPCFAAEGLEEKHFPCSTMPLLCETSESSPPLMLIKKSGTFLSQLKFTDEDKAE